MATAGFESGWVVVRRVSATGSFGVYGVVNDNGTNDGAFVKAAPAGRSPSQRLPVVVETSSFRTELVLANPTDGEVRLRGRYVESLASAGSAGPDFEVRLPARTQRVIRDGTGYLHELGAGLGPAGALSVKGSGDVREARGQELRPPCLRRGDLVTASAAGETGHGAGSGRGCAALGSEVVEDAAGRFCRPASRTRNSVVPRSTGPGDLSSSSRASRSERSGRLADTAALTAPLTRLFSLKVAWALAYVNKPAPLFGKTDAVTTAALVAKL